MARKMRDSGVEWIGEVPEGWKVARLKSLFSYGKGLAITKADLVPKGVPVISYGQIHAKTNSGTHLQDALLRHVSVDYLQTDGDCLLKKNDFVFADTSEDLEGLGNCAFVDRDDKIFAGYHTIVFHPKCDMPSKYLAYLFKTDCWRSQFRAKAYGIKVYSLSQRLLNDCSVVLPQEQEAERIADYLDEKCAAIDGAVDELKRGIEDCKAWKKAIIFEAVTGKANVLAASACAKTTADKKNAKVATRQMRDSGIPWIGEIPEGWEVKRLRFIAEITTGNKDTQDANPDGAYPFYVRSPIVERSADYTFDGLGIMMAGDGAGAGRIFHLADGKYAVHQRVYRIFNFKNIGAPFLWRYFMATFPFEVDKGSAQSTVPSVRLPMLLNHCIMFPSLPKQRAIADYLDEKCAAIDAMVAEKEKLIADLEAYKKSLIFELVTGKREVA